MKLRSLLPFAAGLAVGGLLTATFAVGVARVKAAPAQPAASFADVPTGNPAAPSVGQLHKHGVVIGYPDKKFHGDRSVTRYEMAVVLDRFVKYIEQGRKPLHTTSVPTTSSQASAPAGHWAHDSQLALIKGRFIPATSFLLQRPGNKPITAAQFSQALGATVNRVSDRSLPPTPDVDQVE
ncbi:MAG TPA: S-layer homology domain-containing protein [Capsulimonadaceae bacterium]|nr:S-layer homology domain-containing protein [Capsulimonadaceae bacterium]